MTTQERIKLIAQVCQSDISASLLGEITTEKLSQWVTAELGHIDALDTFLPHGEIFSRAYAPVLILHIVSGNTPHAAFQSLLRGLLVGAQNLIKTPSQGMPELETWIESFPPELKKLTEYHSQLTEEQWHEAEVVIAIGSDDSIESIHSKLRPHQKFIPHGHKVSIGVVTSDFEKAAYLAAKDCSLYNQRGCLSPHAIYVKGNVQEFAEMMAHEIEQYSAIDPPLPLSLQEAGAIQNLRQSAQFIAANDDGTQLWLSSNNLNWTIILEQSAELKLSCLNRCVYIKPLPEQLDTQTLGPESAYLSTIAIHPFTQSFAKELAHLPAHRICPLGSSHQPDLFWHHDGFAPLASLVSWKDIG